VSQYTFPSTEKKSVAWARVEKQKTVAMRTATAKVFAILPPLGVKIVLEAIWILL
jgi:hypothetical protein